MSGLHAFTNASSTSISAEQRHRKTQIPNVNMKTDRCHQPNTCIAPPFLHLQSQPIKPKSVTAPLNEAVRARLCGNYLPTTNTATHCRTSGSDRDIDTKSFADMMYGCWSVDQHGLQGDCSPSNVTIDCEVDVQGSNSRDDIIPFLREQLCQTLQDISSSTGTELESCLLQYAAKALTMANEKAGFNASENAEQKTGSQRFVMNTLRFAGYNAAICKSRWDQSMGYPAGVYEFIDVVIEGSKRFFVDINFRAQFEIARPTDEYNALLQKLPIVFVGRADKLCRIIKIMCDAARRSLKERVMYIPPWRRYRYMQAKWLGSYRRTINPGSRAAQGDFLQFPFSDIKLNATGWDASVIHRMEEINRNADRNLMAKSKYTKQGDEQLGFGDLLLIGSGQRDRYENKISGLATALADAGLTTSSPSNGA